MNNSSNSSDHWLDLSHDVCPRVVAFFGPDGAGKSTQAGLLIEHLRQKGYKVKKAWIRSVHTFAFLLWNLFRKLNLLRGESAVAREMHMKPAVSYFNETSYGAVSPITTSPPILAGSVSRFIWSSIEVVSIIPVVLVQVYLPLILGFKVVAERYVVDSVASIAYFLDDPSFIDSWNAKLLMKLVPGNTVFVFVDADYNVILGRRRETAGPPNYTEFHRKVFKELAQRIGAYYIDTSKLSIEEAHKEILTLAGLR